jgi:hypothetical protein
VGIEHVLAFSLDEDGVRIGQDLHTLQLEDEEAAAWSAASNVLLVSRFNGLSQLRAT